MHGIGQCGNAQPVENLFAALCETQPMGDVSMRLPLFVASMVTAAALAGCTTFKDLNAGLDTLVGQPVDYAFSKLGYPNHEGEMAGKKVYVWGVSRTMNMPIYTPSTTTGYVGNTPFSVNTSRTTYVPVQQQCTVRLFVDKQTGRVVSWDWEGNQGGCQQYANRVKTD